MWFFSNNSRNRSIYHWINAIFLTILDGNGTQGMWVGDSLQWHVWYAWNAGAVEYKVQCGHADSWEWYPRNFELVVNECKLCWFPYKKKSVLVPVYYIYSQLLHNVNWSDHTRSSRKRLLLAEVYKPWIGSKCQRRCQATAYYATGKVAADIL